jgi:type VI secretion system protein ImpA
MSLDTVNAWLEPLDGEACGPDLEYDASFMELGQAAAGKPETQFSAAEPPNWPAARDLAEQLFGQTRDLRVAMLWARALVNLEGLEGLPTGLTLLHGLLDRHWEELHPRPDPDDGDTFARLSVLGNLDAIDGLLGDVRQAPLLVDRRLGGLRVRAVEIALERLAPRADEESPSLAQIQGTLADLPDLSVRLRVAINESLQALKQLQSLMNDRFGIESAVDIKTLRQMLTGVQSLLPEEDSLADAGGDDAAETDDEAPAAPARRGGGPAGGVLSVESRQDALRAINLVCDYLERHEPTNPAQLLLRRAERLIDKNFLQLIRDFAPDALNEVARVLGVDPESLRDSDSY